MKNFSVGKFLAVLALSSISVSVFASSSSVRSYNTVYGTNFGTGSSYAVFLGNQVNAVFNAQAWTNNGPVTDAKFSFKNAQDGIQGVGVTPIGFSDTTSGEIDLNESITGSFSKNVIIKNFTVGLLFNGGEYGDGNEKAKINVVYADRSTASFTLIATGDHTAIWSGTNGSVVEKSPAILNFGGAWSVVNPFGNKLVHSITFGAKKTNSPTSNQSDYSLVSITAAVPEPETYAMLLAGLAAIGAVARRKKKA